MWYAKKNKYANDIKFEEIIKEIKIKLGVNTTYMSKIQKIFVKILHK